MDGIMSDMAIHMHEFLINIGGLVTGKCQLIGKFICWLATGV